MNPLDVAMINSSDDSRWHLDRRVPLALITAIAIQTGGIIWWSASISERVNQLEAWRLTASPLAEKTIRLEAQMDLIIRTLADVQSDVKLIIRK